MASIFSRIANIMVLLFISLVLVSNLGGQTRSSDVYFKQTISSEMIRDAGLFRIADLLQLVDDWQLSSIDGNTWLTSMNGLSSYQQQAWSVMVDGQPMDMDLFNAVQFNMLPVSLELIDSIEIYSVPVLHKGLFTDRGLVHIYTKTASTGATLKGSINAGQMIGDPGPYLLTKYSTPNIDSYGPNGFVDLGLGKKSWKASAFLAVTSHPHTHSIFGSRNIYMIGEWPGVLSVIPAVRIRYKRANQIHDFSASHSYSTKHFLFFPPLGTEIPTDSRLTNLGLHGTLISLGTSRITYRMHHSQQDLQYYPNTAQLDFDWNSSSSSANLEWNHLNHYQLRQIGVKLTRHGLLTDYSLDSDHSYLTEMYTNLQFETSPSLKTNIDGFLTLIDEHLAFKGRVGSRLRLNNNNIVGLNLSYSERLLEEDSNWLYWSTRGYDLLRKYTVDSNIKDNIDISYQTAADLFWQIHLYDGLQIDIAASYRHIANSIVYENWFQVPEIDCSMENALSITGNGDGEIVGVNIHASQRVTKYVSHKGYYGFWVTMSGNSLIMDQWASIPSHKASYQVVIQPVPNFSIWGMLSYSSSTNWPDYQKPTLDCYDDTIITLPESIKLKEHMVLDLQIQKWFMHRRIQGALLVRNLTNEEFKIHPAGGIHNLSFYIKATLFLDSFSNSEE
ncbi:TonB-dependent receptor plug domain-containing protein [Candidatus Neomarinimicrobiota bacterium]